MDRDLDKEVAEKVMGFKKIRMEKTWGGMLPNSLVYGEHPLRGGAGIPLPPFSTHIDSAWQVLEKIKSFGNDIEIEITTSFEVIDEWTVAVRWFQFFEDEEQQWGWFYFTDKTAQLAICKAALKVFEK